MADRTKIEWTRDINGNPGKTWNPITGCTPISEGCEHCYARRMAQRLAGRYGYPKDDPFRVTFHPDRLDQPLKWKKPRMVFVCSMADLFHEDVSFEHIREIWQVMGDPRIFRSENGPHIWLLLTKRPGRALEFHEWLTKHWPASGSWGEIWHSNIYLGVTCENQQRADERIPILLQIPAAVRFVSIEPMLGPVELVTINGAIDEWHCDIAGNLIDIDRATNGLDWVILGGETGPGARPMHPDWARSVQNQCQAAGVPFFFKKHGDYNRKAQGLQFITDPDNAGRLLDGRLWEEYPK